MQVRHTNGFVTFEVADDSAIAKDIVRRTVEASVNQLAEKYAQYQGYVDGWYVVRVTHDVRTKLGLAFAAGDMTLGIVQDDGPELGQFVTCWSVNNGIATSVPASKVVAL